MNRLAPALAIALGVLVLGPALALAGVSVDGLEVGAGLFMNADGSAVGAFHAVLTGRTALGMTQQISVDGNVATAAMAPGGQVTFEGLAVVDLGDGTASLPRVPFSVTATADSVLLALDSTALPAAAISGGSITIE
jgi:hypothetical protein